MKHVSSTHSQILGDGPTHGRLCALLAIALAGCSPYYGGATRCEDSSTCPVETFCHQRPLRRVCEVGIDQPFTVTIIEATAEATGPFGDWDADGTGPDISVQYGVRDADNESWLEECETTTVPDSFSPEWGESCEFTFEADGVFAIWFWDEDSVGPEFGGGVFWAGDDALTSLMRTDGEEAEIDVDEFGQVRWTVQAAY